MNRHPAPLLTASNVGFAYSNRAVLRDVSLTIAPGEFVGLIGVNGSGKSTLLRALLGFLPVSGGEVQLGGNPLGALTRREIARRATLVQQDPRFDLAFTGREVVAMGRLPYMGRFAPESDSDRDAVRRAMRVTRTEEFATRPATELSGGERQRLHLARALAQDTGVLLLDELTANLDLAYQYEAFELVRDETRRGKAALAAVHDLTLAARFCDRLLLLADGRIAISGTPAEVVTGDTIAHHFGLRAEVTSDDNGGLFIRPTGLNRTTERFGAGGPDNE